MSSFRKRYVKKKVPFTRTSAQTGQVITSSGNLSLDVLLGGGLPTGSICLIEEDKFATYSKVLAKYFMAEGVGSRQGVFLGSLDDNPKEMIEKLPKALLTRELETEEKEIATEQNGLRIAWRYNDLPLVTSEKTNSPIGHQFNLMEEIEEQVLLYADTVVWSDDPSDKLNVIKQEEDDVEEIVVAHYNNENQTDATYVMDSSNENELESSNASAPNNSLVPSAGGEEKNATGSTETSSSLPTPPPPICTAPAKADIFENSKYSRLLQKIQTMLRDDKFQLHSGGFFVMKSLCRVCITSLASPLWYEDNFGKDLLKFLNILRATIRSSVSVCFITMPMHMVAKYDESLVPKIRNLVDFAVELESFAGSDMEANPAFKEYHGLIHLRKISAINTLSAYTPETTDLAFRLRRTKFVIEKLHLPPELKEESGTPMDTQPTLSCGSFTSPNPKISMDF